jgi:hypothetical protein
MTIPTRVRIIRPGEPDELQEYALKREPGYEVLKQLIEPILDNCHLEHVNVWADFDGGTNYKRLDMFVDETGLLKGLQRNEEATTLYRRANQLGMSAAPIVENIEDLSFICGTAVLFSRRVWF